MTEKRFTLTNPKNAFQEMKCGIDDKTFDKTLTFNEVVDRLNRFQDLSIDDLKQIEQLKKENEQLKKSYDISEDYNDSLSKENEELHQIQMELVTERDSLRKENTNLFDENERLKHRLAISEKARYVTTLEKENDQLKQLIKKVLETTPIEHSLAMDLKNSIRELYE